MKPLYLNQQSFLTTKNPIEGAFVNINGEPYNKIRFVDQMPPFFISVVSPGDHWIFISSNGALTAGRRNAENALFPYYTDDKIHDGAEITGSKTIFRIEQKSKVYLWEPFSNRYQGIYRIERNLYKNYLCNKIIFEEQNIDLGVSFRYAWCTSTQFGFIKKSELLILDSEVEKIEVLDGIQNLLPYGTDIRMQNERSTLLDAYKKNELLSDTKLGIFSLSSIPVDRAEPSEALIATTVWSTGLENTQILLSANQLGSFRKTGKVKEEVDIRATRCAYFIHATLTPEPKNYCWYTVAEINQGPDKVNNLNQELEQGKINVVNLEEDIADGDDKIARIVGAADGFQSVNDTPLAARHYANVLFNVMRGGTSNNNYTVLVSDFSEFVKTRNKPVHEVFKKLMSDIDENIDIGKLGMFLDKSENTSLKRIFREYLPLTFSRRHGDPSRPWNRFSIDLYNVDGSEKLNYEGNWRDIFQNWEALAYAFPEFTEGMICKFLNASTIDGYNPYRITREGIDWEIVDPDDPWSYIGYWGDHQIIYLQKLLEVSTQFHPGQLDNFLNRSIFSYANVPYRIKEYAAILENPFETVDFDVKADQDIREKVEKMGTDAKLILDNKGKVIHVTFVEKILATLLSKLSNYVPGGGIWLNTQRPEWNDANNALVGNGLSMVTVYYLQRFLQFLSELLNRSELKAFDVSSEIVEFFNEISTVFNTEEQRQLTDVNDRVRRQIMDALGNAGSRFRSHVYTEGLSGQRQQVQKSEILALIRNASNHLELSIKKNRRSDGLYHAYNILSIANEDTAQIEYLQEMLEGQVAVLSAGVLAPKEAIDLLDALRQSSLFREDQHSYILYPDKKLPLFVNRNVIPNEDFESSRFLQAMVEDRCREIVLQDKTGQLHFNGEIRNANILKERLHQLRQDKYPAIDHDEITDLLETYEKVFNHKAFTGRSGTFYGYEGLGCIYWHMVSKLVLAIQENCIWAKQQGSEEDVVNQLIAHYYDARHGLGFNKTPSEYGAFPSDPYSHTPGNAGAQQPGMTGQVKEDILSRLGELGIRIKNGCISFDPFLLKSDEFITSSKLLTYYPLKGDKDSINLVAGELGFTFCQVPIVLRLSKDNKIVVVSARGREEFSGMQLDGSISQEIFRRTGKVQRLEVHVTEEDVLD